MLTTLEADASADQIALVRARVETLSHNVLLVREIPIPTRFSLGVLMGRAEELMVDQPTYSMIIDVTEGARPSAAYRAALKAYFLGPVQSRLEVIAVVVGDRGAMFRAALMMVLGALGVKRLQIHATCAEARTSLGV